MSLWRQIRSGLRVLINRKSADHDAAEEVSHYLAEATAEWQAKGLSPEEARRAVQREAGSNELVICEQIRDYGWENVIGNFLDDVRFAVRRLRMSLRFTLISVFTLALGIGATSFMFSVVEGTLLKPLPYPQSGRIVALRHSAPGLHIDDMNIAASLYFTYKEESRVFQDVAIWVPDTSNITGLTQPEQVRDLLVTNRFLSVLGVAPFLGRAFTAADDDPSSQATIILTDGYWKSRFAGDPAVLGRRILIDGKPNEIIGVLPATFQFMDRRISFLAPFRIRRSDVRLVSFCCQGIARIKPGATLAEANADVARMLPMAPAKFPMNPGMRADSYSAAQLRPRLRPLKDVVVGDVGKVLWLVMITVTIVLVIACANVANLLLVRANGRQQELAVRAALGAGWGRIARELLLESLLLSLTGGALGLAIAYAAVRVLAASDLALLPRIHEIAIDPSVLAFTLGTSLAVGLLFGLVPVLRYGRPLLASALRGESRSFSASKERHQVRNLLVVVQVALALLLLIGSGLMIRTFRALHHVDPGFSNAQDVETVRLAIPERDVPVAENVTRAEEQILRRIESLPFVSHAALISDLPMEGGENEVTYAKDMPSVQANGGLQPIRRYKYVSPGYFATTGARLIVGRDFTWTEVYQQTPVALISESLAREWWGGDPRQALGKQIRESFKDDWREVVGVVADLHDDGIDQKAPTIVYWPLMVKNFGSSPLEVTRNAALVIRTRRASSAALFSGIQSAVATVNPNLPVADARTLDSIYSTSLARTNITLILLASAGAMALFLGVLGIYGVISYSVSQRTREIGIRLALGCPRSQVIRLFMRDGLLLSGIGSACGMIAAIVLTRLMRTLLFEVGPSDPLTYAAASLLMILTAIIANFLPARRAALVDPMRALRAE